MKRLKIYLDTSVISHLEAPDTPEKQADTRKLWKDIEAGVYEACVSPVAIAEIEDCPEPKRSVLFDWLQRIDFIELVKRSEIIDLAEQYLEAGILRPKSTDDSQHIAYACVYNCDMIISWNFKHMVNLKTITGVKSVNALAGYREMPIYTPTILISGGVDDDT